jgi:hypothetical protein
MVFSNSAGIFKGSRWSPQAATFDCMPGVLAVIAHPDTRFFEEVNIGVPAQGTYNAGIFPFLVVHVFHGTPGRGDLRL